MGIEFLDVDAHGRETLLRYFTPQRYDQFFKDFIGEFPHLKKDLPLRDVSLVLNLWEEWKVKQEGGPASTASGAPPPTARRPGDATASAPRPGTARPRAARAAEALRRARLPMAPVRLAFLWHMHQPLYREPETGEYLMPWVRLHATRAYYDMAWMLERHPGIRCTVNFTPVLLEQLEEYVAGTARDRLLDLTARPAADLAPEEREAVLRQFFMVDWETNIRPLPRYWELLHRRGRDLRTVDLPRVAAGFTDAGADRPAGALQPLLGRLRRAPRRPRPAGAARQGAGVRPGRRRLPAGGAAPAAGGGGAPLAGARPSAGRWS